MFAAFNTMLAQMAVHFTLMEIVKCILTVYNEKGHAFLLYMQNGEYWWVTNHDRSAYELYKYPPPIPAISQLLPMPRDAARLEWHPPVINDHLRDVGVNGTLYLSEKEDDHA